MATNRYLTDWLIMSEFAQRLADNGNMKDPEPEIEDIEYEDLSSPKSLMQRNIHLNPEQHE